MSLSNQIRMIDSEASDWDVGIKDSLIIPKEDVKQFIKRRVDSIQIKLDTNKEAYARHELLELLQELKQDAGKKLTQLEEIGK